ncbi:MAG: choice-of-anchor X domain-containing protein [Bryobacteraceae bacterium]|nr:choice-of-anchor X domain-containing protein [Bryobacteraceae bacterium]
MLQRLDASGRVLAVLGPLRDDGLSGDAKPNDGIYTLASTFNEFAAGPISLRVSATFNGSPSLVFSPPATLTVVGTPPPTISFTAPANLSYLSITPTTVSGTVSGSPVTQVVINTISTPVVNGAFTAAIPLAEGPNILTATAATPGGPTGTASITVTLDTTPPHVTITSPPEQFVTTASSISVAGNVNDIVVGTVNSEQARVTVNGAAAQVANRTFLAQNVPLSIGSNTIRAVAVDRSGNSVATQIVVTRQAPQSGQIQLVSGNNQTAAIGTNLPSPLVVSLTEPSGAPAANKQVIFTVTQNNGLLTPSSGGAAAANVVATTNAQGQATATWKLGMRSGAGSDAVQAYAVGYTGTAVFTATASQGTPKMIVVDSGNNQTGAVNQALPKPLIAVVIDAGYNRLANVPVTFTVKGGGGSFGGQQAITVNTDPDGRAAAIPLLGFQEGSSNHLFTADFAGNTGFAANFTASGRGPGDPAKTHISGLVLDNSNQPVPGVTVRAVLTNVVNANPTAPQSAATVQTDAKGAFAIYKAPVGLVKLLVDGSTATVPGPFPTLDYDMVTVAGQVNNVGQPIYLLPIKTNNQLCVTATTGGGTLTVPEAPGFSLTFGPGQVTFPGGSKTGCVSVTVVHPDKVPMVPGFGQQPRFIVTIQPSGALFNPPAPITLPNVDGLAPREVTEMYSYDHDISSFVAIGTGTVSDDGQVIRTNPGVGVLKAGWHCGGNSTTIGAAATCGPCAFCDGQICQPNPVQGNTCFNQCLVARFGTCVNGRCTGEFQPPGVPCGVGGRCDGRGNCGWPCLGPNCDCTEPDCGGCGNCISGNPCIDDFCEAGQCRARANSFCEDACGGRTSGSCAIGNLTGTCDANKNCDLCPSLGVNASCTCGGNALGKCGSNGRCDCQLGGTLSISQLWSNQFAESTPSNSLPYRSGGVSDYILMGTAGGQIRIGLKLKISDARGSGSVLAALLDRDAQSTIVGSQTATALINNTAQLQIALDADPLFIHDYDVVAGIDLNRDNVLQRSEVTVNSSRDAIGGVAPGFVRVVPAAAAAAAAASLVLQGEAAAPVTPVAAANLIAFALGTTPVGVLSGSPATVTAPDLPNGIVSLSHHVGATFDSNGFARIPEHVFPSNSAFPTHIVAAKKIRASQGFKDLITAAFRDEDNIRKVKGAFNNPAVTESRVTLNFKSLTVDYKFYQLADPDLFLAYGEAALRNIAITIDVQRTGLLLTTTRVQVTDVDNNSQAALLDLYDFNYNVNPRAASAQAGYNLLGGPGGVFRIRVLLAGDVPDLVHHFTLP